MKLGFKSKQSNLISFPPCLIHLSQLLLIHFSCTYYYTVLSLNCVQLFAISWTAAHRAPLSFTVSQSLLKFMSTESVVPAKHLILCHLLLFLPSIFPSIRDFSNKSALCIRWPKYWIFSFRVSPSDECSGWFPLGFIGLISLWSKGLCRVFSSTTIQKHQFFNAQPSLRFNSHIRTSLLEKS